MSSSDQLDTEELTSRIWDGCGRCTAQNATFLLGMTDELPELSPTEKRQLLMVQALSDAENSGGYPPPTASELCEGSGIDEPDNSHKVPFYIPQNTTNPDVANANILIHFSESDYQTDVSERICTSMGLPSTYDKLGCKLTMTPKAAVLRLLTSDDLKMVFEAVNDARKEQVKGNGRGKLKKIAVEIINLCPTKTKKKAEPKQKRTQLDDTPASMNPYTAEYQLLARPEGKLRCSTHRRQNRFC
ncbi:hypothetical protein FIBSPDRAFT_961250 [Athelia psychrophila]|uniref:Uncharacterized protein n=1 Tax=Athelia psychrophila TaxID=1759441 RepID=A0A166BDR3_9AGAM|nr:hypothetical protein FIBSPDRAFT_961250 [Fibularhizoctonia sp. CBS 109695]